MEEVSDASASERNGLHSQYLSDQIQAAGSSQPASRLSTDVETATEGSTISSASTFTQLLRDYSIRFWDPLVCCKIRKRCTYWSQTSFAIDSIQLLHAINSLHVSIARRIAERRFVKICVK